MRDMIFVMKVPEEFTSQTCARCGGRFEIGPKRRRFKVCRNCILNEEMMMQRSITSKKDRYLLMLDKARARRLVQHNQADNVSIDLLEIGVKTKMLIPWLIHLML